MYCPKCKKSSLCGCKSCKYRNGKFPRLRKDSFTDKGESYKCPYCREKSHPDEVLDAEWELRKNN